MPRIVVLLTSTIRTTDPGRETVRLTAETCAYQVQAFNVVYVQQTWLARILYVQPVPDTVVLVAVS